MRCKICKKQAFGLEKAKDGRVCMGCIMHLPEFILHNLKKFTIADLKEFNNRFTTDYGSFWYIADRLKLADYCIVLDRGLPDIPIYTGIPLTEITEIDFEFIPRKKLYGNICRGYLCLRLTLKYKELKVRTKICDCTLQMEKSQDRKNPFIPVYTDLMKQLLSWLKQGVREKSFVKIRYEQQKHQYEHQKQKYRQYDRQENKQAENQRSESHSENNQKATESVDKTLQDALLYFHMSMPYTETDLKKRYRELIRKCHPDQKDRDESIRPEIVNNYYEYLKKFAV